MLALFRTMQTRLDRGLRRSIEIGGPLEHCCIAKWRAARCGGWISIVCSWWIERLVHGLKPTFTLDVADSCDHQHVACPRRCDIGHPDPFGFIARVFFLLVI